MGNGYVAYTEGTKRNGNYHNNTYVKSPSGHVRRVNAKGTQSNVGSISGHTLIFQEYRHGDLNGFRQGGFSRLVFYNLKTHHRHIPGALNSKSWEYIPRMNHRWILFGRVSKHKRHLILFNRKHNSSHSLTRGGRYEYVQPGQVSGHFAIYLNWPRHHKSAPVVYNLKTHDKTYLGDGSHYFWAPSIASNGTAYFFKERSRYCGVHMKLVRRVHKTSGWKRPRRVLKFRYGIDTSMSQVHMEHKKPVVYHDRIRCSPNEDDLYKVVDAYKLRVRKGGLGSGSVTSKPRGIKCGGHCHHSFRGGQTVRLTAHPATGSHFAGWHGCHRTGPRTCKVHMYSGHRVRATFGIGP